MFYEDAHLGQSRELGSTMFTRASILAFGQGFDPRVLVRARAQGAPLIASGLHVAAAAMRRLVETRITIRESMAARGEPLPELGVSPGLREMRWPWPVAEGDIVSYRIETVSKRETSKPKWGLVGNRLRGVNQRGEEVLTFSSVVLVARRSEDR